MTDKFCTLGVDIGTTSAKASAYTLDGTIVAEADAGIALLPGGAGVAEQDPVAVVAAANHAIIQAAHQAQQIGYEVERVGVSAAMHSVILVGPDDMPLTNALLWMDSRAHAAADTLWQSPEGRAIYERTGTPIHAMTPLAKLIWIHQTRPDLLARTARIVSLKEWVWHQWFGAWEIDASIASATGLYNLADHAWDSTALALAGLPSPDRLSRIVPTTYTRNDVRDRTLIDAGIQGTTPFTIGASDGVLANLAVGAIGSQDLVLTIGTSCAVRAGSNSIVTNPDIRSFCYVLDDGRYIVGAPSNSGGVVLDWLYHHLLRPSDAPNKVEAFTQAIIDAGKIDSDGVVCLPYLTGERAPLWDADATLTLTGVSLRHTPLHIIRAAVEGIIYNAYWMASSTFEQSGKPSHIIASGKVLEQEWIRQLTADVFGLPVKDASDNDASAAGAAVIADIAAGVRQWPDQPSVDVAMTLYPNDHEAHQQRYRAFRKVAESVLGK
jgi:gluconokinase